MKVGSIGSYYAPNVKRNNTAFKADVRICRDEVASFGDKNELTLTELYKMNSLLKYAKDAYKNVGTDNDIIILQPYIKQDEFDHNKTKYDIKVIGLPKGTEESRRNILDNRKNLKCLDNPKARQLLQDIADREPAAMENLKIPFVYDYIIDITRASVLDPQNTIPSRSDLDRAVKFMVANLHADLSEPQSNFITVSKDPKPREQWDGYIPIGGW